MVKTYSRIVKSAAFSGLLLAASLSAYADAERPVTLANGGGSISWSDFVTAINKPETIKGIVSEDAMTAWTNAQTAWTNAQTAYTTAQNAVKTAAATVSAKNTALAAANNAETNAEKAEKTAQTEYNTKNQAYQEVQGEIAALTTKTETVMDPWLEDSYNNARTFQGNYNAFLKASAADEANYKSDTYGVVYTKYVDSGKAAILTIAFIDPSDSSYTKQTVYDFYYNIVNNKEIAPEFVDIDFGKKDGKVNYTDTSTGLLDTSFSDGSPKKNILSLAVSAIQTLTTDKKYNKEVNTQKYQDLLNQLNGYTDAEGNKVIGAKEAAQTALAALTAAQNAVNDAKDKVVEAQEELSEAQAAQTEAQNAAQDAADKYTEDRNTYNAAETAYNNAVATANSTARANYQNISLTDDVNITEAITEEYSGRINANQHIINVNVPAAFNVFSGRLSNAAINGVIASDYASATFSNVAAYRGTNATSAFYDDHSTRSTYTNLGALGFAARDLYGVNFTENKLTNLGTDNANRVYDITVYELNNVSTQSYVVKSGDAFQSAKGAVTIPANRFAKSATDDLTGVNNVFYGENNTCDNALITDGETFYAPVDIQATNMTYTREFNEGYNTVCLPFELTADANIKALCEYESETPDKLYFTKIEGTIPANTPVLLVANSDFSFENKPATIKKTTDMVIVGKGPGNSSESYGFLKKTGRGEFEGDSQGYRVLGLKGQSFIAAAEGATFPAFRMVVTGSPAAVAASKAPRAIGILDEKGVEITDLLTGVQTVAADEEELTFDIAAGQGEIIFTSFEDFGKVEIYTLDGKVAAVANVTEGTTSVNVQKGLYIVMGKKFVVR